MRLYAYLYWFKMNFKHLFWLFYYSWIVFVLPVSSNGLYLSLNWNRRGVSGFQQLFVFGVPPIPQISMGNSWRWLVDDWFSSWAVKSVKGCLLVVFYKFFFPGYSSNERYVVISRFFNSKVAIFYDIFTLLWFFDDIN